MAFAAIQNDEIDSQKSNFFCLVFACFWIEALHPAGDAVEAVSARIHMAENLVRGLSHESNFNRSSVLACLATFESH